MDRMYHQMIQHITVASAILTDPSTAASEIDRVLNGQCSCVLELVVSNLNISHDVSFSTSVGGYAHLPC